MSTLKTQKLNAAIAAIAYHARPKCGRPCVEGQVCKLPITPHDPTGKRCGLHFHADRRAELKAAKGGTP